MKTHLSASNGTCYPPLLGWLNVLYQIPAENFSALFCLPKKCGTTSYQRALSEHVINFITTNKYNSTKQMSEMAVKWKKKIGKDKISSEDIHAPFVYKIMANFRDRSFLNPMTFVKKNGRTLPVYPPEEELQKRVVNTRNPFRIGCDQYGTILWYL